MSLNHRAEGPRGRRPSRAELKGTFLPSTGGPVEPPTAAVRLQSGEATAPSKGRLEVVVDGGSLLPFHFLRAGDRMGRAVVKLQREDGASGTGFLVAPDILLTNHHVLPDELTAASCVALANYEVSPPADPEGRPAAAPLDPAGLFVSNPDLDFTFCGVAGLDFLGVVPLDRWLMHVAVDEFVTVIQHPRGRPKEIALRDNRVVRADSVVVQYACDTEPGSSGSPVFNDQWKPVAIHHASVLTDSPEGRRVGADSRARYLNEGIRLSAIALWLDAHEASDPSRREAVARLRALFGGFNPRAGFFGALGRRSHGRPAAEGVAEGHTDRLEVLDVGFWDTRALAASAGGLRGQSADVARVVADMGLDVWCFAAATPPALDAICERLWAAHGLSYQPVPIGRPSPGGEAPGVLVRPSKAIAAGPPAGPDDVPHVLLRAAARPGVEAEFLLIPAGAEGVPPGPSPRPGPSTSRLILAVDELAPALVDLADDAPAPLVGLAPEDGGFALIPGDSPPATVFLSPNLHPIRDPASRLAPARDRSMPPSLSGLPGPRPIALRIALDPAPPAPDPAPHAPTIPPPPPSRGGDGLDLLIERKLRALLGPVVSKILSESRPDGA